MFLIKALSLDIYGINFTRDCGFFTGNYSTSQGEYFPEFADIEYYAKVYSSLGRARQGVKALESKTLDYKFHIVEH